MTTKNSPLRKLKLQADLIAFNIKSFERGVTGTAQFAAKLEAARKEESLRVGVVMDDKVIKIDLPWSVINVTSETGLSAYILKLMRETRDDA